MGKLFANCCLQKGTHAEIKGIPGDSASVSDRHRLRNVNISRCWFKSLQHVSEHNFALWLPACMHTNNASCCLLFTLHLPSKNFTDQLAVWYHPTTHSSACNIRGCKYWQTGLNHVMKRNHLMSWFLLFPNPVFGDFLKTTTISNGAWF